MSDTTYAKCGCQSCGRHLEFPVEAVGATIACPSCQQPTVLFLPGSPEDSLAAQTTAEVIPDDGVLTRERVAAAFTGPVRRTRVPLVYQLGLCVVALTMVVLPLIYLAMVAAAGYAVYFWATHFTWLMSGGGGRVIILKFLCYATPLFVGAVVVFFMIKPLLARRAPAAQPLALNPDNEPVLFDFIARICAVVGAPFPRRVDLDCQLNASAGFRRGVFSFLSNDLILTIGLPLVAGMNTRQLAGVLAHEFGHFTQGFGMRLTYVIRSVNGWFARVVYERDAWDVSLEQWGHETEDWRILIIVNLARLAVWCSRLLLKLLMYLGHGIGCFMLRQMEYDADSYQIKLVGSQSFEDTMRRLHVLAAATKSAYQGMRVGWNTGHTLPDDFPAWLMGHEAKLTALHRTQLEDTMGLEATGLFHTHPSNGDRIRRARQAGEPGVFALDAPARDLFGSFEVVSRQVTALHYEDDLGIPLAAAKLTPVQPLPSPNHNTSEEPSDLTTKTRFQVRRHDRT